jgi:hypothetical protein
MVKIPRLESAGGLGVRYRSKDWSQLAEMATAEDNVSSAVARDIVEQVQQQP